MTDYGRSPAFGWFPSPLAADYAAIVAQVRAADAVGLDLIGVQDHPYQSRFLDTWALIPALAAVTERIAFFPDVANLPLRPPAVLAKAAASIDVMSGGRVELGLGAGGFWDAIAAMGGPRRTPGDALRALEEAVAVIRLLWSGQRGLRFDGEHYRLAGIHSGPVPAHDMGIWLGVIGPRALALAGRVADGWVPSSPYVPPDRLAEAHARIDEAAVAAGRDPAAIRRVYNVNGTITAGRSDGPFAGPPDQWADELTALVLDRGMDTFVLWAEGDPLEQVHRLGEEVAPRVREQVAAARA